MMHRFEAKESAVKGTILAVVGLIGLVVSGLLFPPVFDACFAMAPLFEQQRTELLVFSTLLFIASAVLILLRSRIAPGLGLLFLSGLMLVATELGVRLGIRVLAPQTMLSLARQANRTYPHMLAYRGHPFVQFTGNPSSELIGNSNLGDLTPFNNFGFHGPDFRYEKPSNTLRVVALGGSTTASGYPQMMQEFLNRNKADSARKYEVMNLAHGWYNSAHVLINFVLNAVDFSPDYVVIHSGWNDRFARNAVQGFRGDYAHALKAFEPPAIVDRYPIRWSVLYRYLKFKVTPEPYWTFLDSATRVFYRRKTSKQWEDATELAPYERNIRIVIELALLRRIKVVLTTQPHSTDPAVEQFDQAVHIDQCNAIIRRLHAEFAETYLADLDQIMTGKMNDIFSDLGHLHPPGRRFKAEQIGQLILGLQQER